jgi:hypothetical protein
MRPVLVAGSERACKTMFHAPNVHFISFLLLSRSCSRILKWTVVAYSKDHSSHQALAMERLFSSCTRSSQALTMEHLFSPCIRYFHGGWQHKSFERQGPRELKLDVSIEELLSPERAFTYTDLYAMLRNGQTMAWLTPHAAVMYSDASPGSFCDENFGFNADGKRMAVVLGPSSEELVEICHVVLRLLAASVIHSVCITGMRSSLDVLINAPTLAYLMEQCQSLRFLSLTYLEMDGDHIRVLGDSSKPGLEIELQQCRATGAAGAVLAQVLGRNQGPTTLENWCGNRNIDNLIVVADGLRGNTRLKSWRAGISKNSDVDTHDKCVFHL